VLEDSEAIWAYAYPEENLFDYSVNKDLLESVGATIIPLDDAFRKDLASRINDFIAETSSPRRIRIGIDISSLDRDRIAQAVSALVYDLEFDLEIDFYYSPAAYDSNLIGSEGRVVVNRPLQGFEGWSSEPDLPLACVMGLGFESNLALAALETLEPSRTTVLVARDIDSRYDFAVTEKNGSLLRSRSSNVIEYSINRPARAVILLESIVHSLRRDHRVVLVPIGTKLLALASLLVGCVYGDDITVWRVSADTERIPENRVCNRSPSIFRVVRRSLSS
jgi:hypothetical protein